MPRMHAENEKLSCDVEHRQKDSGIPDSVRLSRPPVSMVWLHRYTMGVAVTSLLLIIAGGLVTSTGSGLAVPDWPTSYGYFMFSFPFSKMVGGVFYEHVHRLIASTVGLLTVLLTVWVWCIESRPLVKRLALITLTVVVIQGILGGITVLYFLPAPISITHAGLAHIFFCLIVSLTIFTSRGWLSSYHQNSSRIHSGNLIRNNTLTLQRVAIATTLIIYIQIIVGATMRHTGAGLAIPDYPLAFGKLIPPHWDQAIYIHFAHRVGALVTLIAVLVTARCVWGQRQVRKELIQPLLIMIVLVLSQIVFGGWTVLSGKSLPVNTAHVSTGALLLAFSLSVALRACRSMFSDNELVSSPMAIGNAQSAERKSPAVSSQNQHGFGL